MIALTVFAIIIMSSCTKQSSKLDKFIGAWKRVDKPDKDTVIIKREDVDIVIFKGKDTLTVRYDNGGNNLKIYGLSTSMISYVEKTDHILVDNGEDCEFKRLK